MSGLLTAQEKRPVNPTCITSKVMEPITCEELITTQPAFGFEMMPPLSDMKGSMRMCLATTLSLSRAIHH